MPQSAAVQNLPNPNYFDDSRSSGDSLNNPVVPVSGSVTTNATQRLGKQVQTVNVSTSLPDSTEFGTGQIGSVTIPGASNAKQIVDSYRQGTEVRTINQFDSMLTPLMRFSREPLNSSGTSLVNFDSQPEAYGTPKLFYAPDPNSTDVAKSSFEDIPGIVDPVALVNNAYANSSAYPIINDNLSYLDPAARNGRIEVLDVTRTFSNTLISDGLDIRGVKSSLMGPNSSLNNLKGSVEISNRYEVLNSSILSTDKFEDAQNNFSYKEDGSPTVPLPGYISQDKYGYVYFDDSSNWVSKNGTSYSFVDNKNFLTAAFRDVSETGTRFKSATNGLIFGESNALGTDSIAFGGLKK
jgi:hypothetical protein